MPHVVINSFIWGCAKLELYLQFSVFLSSLTAFALTHHWAWKMPKKVVPRQSGPCSVKTALRLLKEMWRSGREHSSRAFWKVVHFFCRVLVPPRSPWERTYQEKFVNLPWRRPSICGQPFYCNHLGCSEPEVTIFRERGASGWRATSWAALVFKQDVWGQKRSMQSWSALPSLTV